jgi:hypothetical protein
MIQVAPGGDSRHHVSILAYKTKAGFVQRQPATEKESGWKHGTRSPTPHVANADWVLNLGKQMSIPPKKWNTRQMKRDGQFSACHIDGLESESW